MVAALLGMCMGGGLEEQLVASGTQFSIHLQRTHLLYAFQANTHSCAVHCTKVLS